MATRRSSKALHAAVVARLEPRRAIKKRAAARTPAFLYAADGLVKEADKKGYKKCTSFFTHGVCTYGQPERPCCNFPCGAAFATNPVVVEARKVLDA